MRWVKLKLGGRLVRAGAGKGNKGKSGVGKESPRKRKIFSMSRLGGGEKSAFKSAKNIDELKNRVTITSRNCNMKKKGPPSAGEG